MELRFTCFPNYVPLHCSLLQFGILKCDSGIVVTASHNPKEYNGYKAYWNDGAQVVPPHDKNITTEVKTITSFGQVKFNADASKIHTIGPEVEEGLLRRSKKTDSEQKCNCKSTRTYHWSIRAFMVPVLPWFRSV